MVRVTFKQAAKQSGMFDVHSFRGSGTTKKSREAEWLKFRTKGVGGSDMSTILGLNTFETPARLWEEKTGRRTPDDISDKWSIVKGNALEPELRNRFKRIHAGELETVDGSDKSLVSKEHPCMHASLDGLLYDPKTDSYGVLEIKTANEYRGKLHWHDQQGNLVIPDYYMAQVTHYLAVTGFTWGWVYADIGESEPVEIRFERDEQDVQTVINAAEEFWHFVQNDEMPQLTGTDVDRVQAEQPYPEGFEQIEDSDFDQLSALYESYAQAESDARKSKARIADRLKQLVGGQREGLISPKWQVGYRTVHFKEQAARPAKPAYDQRRFYVKQLKEN
ncbi:YqaJ viral recombinase family nuclease [Bifidobacterium vansinderenii]|uniref:Endonuclease n=1 Tax=Bifidobacterium vansinderenii TaxID=1984871 RepID=A0A229VWC3_9BIFI|nr:YqaJ viral recombinase family protein [Bifidobacterium vansinderenii]OXM99912.1 endonuclease [Bifidobacterium vansinderenii]